MDSGRTSGPKGANLGELAHHFGERVPPGFVIPFGFFRHLLDRPLEPGGPSVWEWMLSSYSDIAAAAENPDRRQQKVREFLARLREWILSSDLGPDLTAKLRTKLRSTFGADGTYGVFVRSDTNVEDLPGFTGAGLNLTVPNVVGEDEILRAIHRVWASPFTERAYGWRQAHMAAPEYVFPAVVVQLGFPAEKSGVLVTQDVDSGRRDWLSVAVNEGVGGAVDGQASESLRVPLRGGRLLYLAQATAPQKAVLDPAGGVTRRPASGTEAVLTQDEVVQLSRLSVDVAKFPSLRDDQGRVLPADIEFAFKDGQLALLQIRPFVESRSALESAYLRKLDAAFRDRGRERVALDAVPASPGEQVKEEAP
jgi:phosphoenolpyruvate synthase/pyruvate phosphate dikinase